MVLGGLWRLLWGGGSELRILQWNCNGIRPKAAQFRAFLLKEKIDIALIQETHLNPHHSFSLGPDFIIVRNDRRTHKGGVMSVFRSSLTRVHRLNISPPAGVEGQSWMVGGLGGGLRALLLHNWYLTPTRRANKEFSLNSVKPYMRQTGLLLGDFNCKSPWWGYKGTDTVGRSIQSLVEHNNLVFLNEKGVSTLRHHGTTPDLSLATGDLAGRCSWRAGDYLGSDHRLILINVNLRRQCNTAGANRIVPLAAKPRTRRRRWTVKRLVKTVKGVFGSILNLFRRKRARRTIRKNKS